MEQPGRPLTALEAAAFRGVRARQRLLAFEAAAIRADFDASLSHLAARMGLDPAAHGRDYTVDADSGVVLLAGPPHADRLPDHDHA